MNCDKILFNFDIKALNIDKNVLIITNNNNGHIKLILIQLINNH